MYFPPRPKLFSLEIFQQYTANILPLWNSAGKFCNLRKHLSHLTSVSTDLQTGDQKKKKKNPPSKYFWFSSKGVGDVCDGAYCCCSVAKSCPTLCDPMDCSTQASLSSTDSRSLLKLMSIVTDLVYNNLLKKSGLAFTSIWFEG